MEKIQQRTEEMQEQLTELPAQHQRYLPRPATGEFVDVAVIAGSDQAGDWALRRVTDLGRALAFGTAMTLDAGPVLLDQLQQRIDAGTMTQCWLVEASERHRNVVQFSKPAPVLAGSAEQAVTFLWPHLIVEAPEADTGVPSAP